MGRLSEIETVEIGSTQELRMGRLVPAKFSVFKTEKNSLYGIR